MRFFSNMATLVVFIYFSHNILKVDNGNYVNFWVYLTVLSTVATAGVAMLSFTYSAATLRKLAAQISWRYYSAYLLFVLAVSVVFCSLVYFNGYAQASILPILLMFFVGNVLNVLFEAFLMNFKKFKFLLSSSILYAVAYVAIHLYIAQSGYDFYKIIGCLSVLVVAKLLLNIFVCRQAFRAVDVADAVPIHLSRVRSTWLHLFAFEGSQIFVRYLDKLLVSFIVVKELSAIYFNGTVDIPFLPILLAAVSNSASLFLSKSQRNDKLLHKQIISDSSSIMATASFSLFAFLFFYRNEFIAVAFSEKYIASIPIFAVALLKLLPNIFTLPFYLQYKQRAGLINKGAIIDVIITIILLYPLYTWVGLAGIVLSFVLSSFVQGAYYTYCAAKLLQVSPLSLLPVRNWALKMIVFTGLAYTSHYLLSGFLSENVRLIFGVLIIGAAGFAWLLYEYKKSKLLNFAT